MFEHTKFFNSLIFDYGFEGSQAIPLCLSLPSLPSFFPSPQYFEVSDTNVTGQAISIDTNNFATKGGGGGSVGTGVDGSCGYVAAYGSIGLTFNYDYSEGVFGVPAIHPFVPHAWGEFNGIAFAIGTMRVNTVNSNLVWLCSAYLSNPVTGELTIKRIGLNNVLQGGSITITSFSYRNGIYTTVVPIQDSVTNVSKLMCVQWTNPNTLSFTSSPLLGTIAYITPPYIHQDSTHIHIDPLIGSGGKLDFDRFNAPDGTPVIENTTHSITLASGVSTSTYNYPVILDAASFPRQPNNQKFMYNDLLNVIPSVSLRLRVRIENPNTPNTFIVLDTIADQSLGSGNMILKVSDSSPINGITNYVVLNSIANTDSTFPHKNLSANNTSTRRYIVYQFKDGVWGLSASFSDPGIFALSSPEQGINIFALNTQTFTMHKGLFLNKKNFFFLTDYHTGSLVRLENVMPAGNLPINTVGHGYISSTPNYVILFGTVQGSPKLTYLSFDR